METATVTTLALAMLLFPVPSWAKGPLITESHIYPDSALFTIAMPEEAETLDLPGTVDPDSIRVETRDGLAVPAYSIDEIPRSGWIPPALEDLCSQVEKSKEDLGIKGAAAESLKQAVKHLDCFSPEIKPEEMPSYINVFLRTRKDLTDRLIRAESDLDRAKKKNADLEKLLSSRLPKDSGVTITLSPHPSAGGELSVRCSTSCAGWSPAYRLALDLEKSIMTAELTGTVSQKTGLDFTGKINLHTGAPTDAEPDLDLPPMTVRLKKKMDDGPVQYSRAMGELDAMKLNMTEAAEETLMDKVYSFSSSVPGDGTPSTVTLESWTAQVETVMVAVPSVNPSSWLLAEGVLPDGITLSAPCETYVDRRFSGRGVMPKLVKGERFSIPFGEIPGIRISRHKKIPRDGSNWTGKGTLRQGYAIKVINGLNLNRNITVKDRIPVAVNNRISLTIAEMSPPPKSADPETGLVTWILSLNPGETKEINVLYDLKYPSDMEPVFSR